MSKNRFRAQRFSRDDNMYPNAATLRQVQDVRGLKALIWCGNRYGWEHIIAQIREVLQNLPLTSANITVCSDEILETHGGHMSEVTPEKEATPLRASSAYSSRDKSSIPEQELSPELKRTNELERTIGNLEAANAARYDELKAQLAALREEAALDEMGVAHTEYKKKVEDMLADVQQRKANIIASYPQKNVCDPRQPASFQECHRPEPR